MEALITFLLKSAAVLGLFYCCYMLFLKNETFFKANRYFLLSGILASISIPFISIKKTIWIEATNLQFITSKPIANQNIQEAQKTIATTIDTPFNWLIFFLSIYYIGVLFFIIRFTIQYWSVTKILNTNNQKKKGDFSIIETENNIAPFSFFKTIVYCKNMYSSDELKVILAHEKAHCNQYHTIDIIFSHILIALQWFNPFVWLYQKAIQQNLEFLADASTIHQNVSVSNYQNVLLKAITIQVQPNNIVNNFYQSLIKKRIIMLHKKTSPKQLWKLLLILPLITGFIYSCGTETIVKEKEVLNEALNKTENTQFITPVTLTDNIKIASEFGIRNHPITKEEKMHNGIDFSAPLGTPVYAASSGIVAFAGNKGGYGKLIVLKHANNYTTKYGQLSKMIVSSGAQVTAGDLIGKVGNTGLSTGPHLHYEILRNGNHINPKPLLGEINGFQIIFTKDFTPLQIEKAIEEAAKNGISIKISSLERNSDGEIITISMDAITKNGSSNWKQSGIIPIKTFLFHLNKNEGSFGVSGIQEGKNIPFKKKHLINKKLTNSTLRIIETKFNNSQDNVQIKLTNIKRNQDGLINHLVFTSKFTNQERFFKNFDARINNKTNEIFSFYYNEKKQGVQITYPNQESILITKDGSVGHMNAITGQNPLHIINNKEFTQEYLKDKIITSSGSITKMSPLEAQKKYGNSAKDGAIVYNGKSTIKEKSILFIVKNMLNNIL